MARVHFNLSLQTPVHAHAAEHAQYLQILKYSELVYRYCYKIRIKYNVSLKYIKERCGSSGVSGCEGGFYHRKFVV